MKRKTTVGWSIVLFLVILFLPTVSASLGVAPARTTIDYQPGVEKEFIIRVLNRDHNNMKVMVQAQGELAEYVTVNAGVVSFTSKEGDKEISISVNIPETDITPGPHMTNLVIFRLPDSYTEDQTLVAIADGKPILLRQGSGSTAVTASGAVVSQLQLNVPYPGTYAKAKLFTSEAQVGKNTVFTVSLLNLGKNKIDSAKSDITVLGPFNEEITRLKTNEISLEPLGKGKITAEWKADVNPGPYFVTALVDYDGKKIQLEKRINVGNILVDINNVEVGPFSLGDIAKFNFLLENRWSEDLTGVYAEAEFFDEAGQPVSSTQSIPVNIPALGETKAELYWDTTGLSIGEYLMKITLHYNGKTTEKTLYVNVNLDSISTSFSPTALAVGTEKKESSRDVILIVIIVLLLAINIGWFLYMRKIRPKA